MTIQIKMTRDVNCKHYGVPAGTIVTIDMENEYLPICVSSEIYESNSRTPPEAKKAQAIAARTYAISHMRSGTVIDDTANYQAFSWKEPSSIPNCMKATRDTSGLVLMCDGKLITAWYSNSNGGRTKSSEEAWGGATAWTVSQEDPWDTAGRAKWGEVKASHSVGMSQIGAAWAAYSGIDCATILAFYYPNTATVAEYGDGGALPDAGDIKSNTGLVAHAQKWVGQAYWYGTCCYACSQQLLNSKSKQYPEHYTESRMPRYQQDIKSKKSCADCIGLLKGYLWEKDGQVVYNAETDVSANGLYNRASVKGLIGTLPEVPGLMLYKSGHVGVYVGDGGVVEAKGFSYGVIRSRVEDTAWTHWLVVPWLSYAGYEELLKPVPIDEPYTAVVVTKSSPLNIWADTKKSKSLGKVAKGDTLTVTGYADTLGWFAVTKGSISGVADGQYLTRQDGAPDEGDDPDDADDTDPAPPAETPYPAVVTGVKTGLNLRTAPKNANNTILLMPPGARVTVLDADAGNGFARVDYQGTEGYATRVYLKA